MRKQELKKRIEKIEADFVSHLLASAIKKGDILADSECVLMDDIFKLKEDIEETIQFQTLEVG